MNAKFDTLINLLMDNRGCNITDDLDVQDIACRIMDFISNAKTQNYDNAFVAAGIFTVIFISGWFDDDAHTIAEAVWDIFFSEKYPY